ncbi:glycosyltransferase [Luteolibacter ambystomatis]|uniref:Glycosyltransferase n=1 Tax=Luteolibacter ambystomatis TaxID=2824561 RepID=A0A975PF99_9BACT|nr:glycosyltransferase [Luteolibacter ambystomatis]QUE51775.1 glycosyltransferase [Luteolibacter ambystomatis]
MKVALYTGWLAPQDATGHSVLAMHEALLARGAESLIYCDRSSIQRPEVRVMNGARSHFREWRRWRDTDVHLFHFGASYDLFNLLPWIPRGARRMVYFHGLTPRALVPEADRGWVDHSRRKFRIADRADVVLHATGYSKDLALSMGVTRPDYIPLPLPVDLPEVPRPARRADGVFRLLHVGRLVANKGLLEIVRALHLLETSGCRDWELEVVHNPLSANAIYETQVREFLAASGLTKRVRFTGPPASRLDLAERYASADLTVLATRHETYCLPLLESLRCGTPVVACAAGAIPESAAGLALLVPPDDITALAAAIARARDAWPRMSCDEFGTMDAVDFHTSCRALLKDRTSEVFGERLRAILTNRRG